MVSIETIKEQFDELGIEPSDEVVDRCIEICLNNNIDDPVEFVEQWMAYSVSKLSGAEPTIAYLNEMEANEYTSKARKMGKASSMAGAGPNSLASPRLDSKVSKLTTYRNVDSVEQDVLQMYGCNTPKANKSVSRLQHSKNTPDSVRGSPFATVTYSPLSSKKESEPSATTGTGISSSKSGQIVYTYGKAQLLKQINWLPSTETTGLDQEDPSAKESNGKHYRPALIGNRGLNVGLQVSQFANETSKYMFDSSYDRVMILSDRIFENGSAICYRLAQELAAVSNAKAATAVPTASTNRNGIDGETNAEIENNKGASIEFDAEEDGGTAPEWFDGIKVHRVNYPSSEPIRVLGRVLIDAQTETGATGAAAGGGKAGAEGRLSIVDFDEQTIRQAWLDLSQLRGPWSLFPGQTVLLEGINPRGSHFTVQRIHHERMLNLPRAPYTLERPLTMVIASAPFTARDDLLYERLTELLHYCASDPPDVLLLCGPFADASCSLYSEVAETFEEYFEKIVGTIMGALGAARTEVFIVANHDEVTGSFVYPTPPYRVANFYKNLHFLPDPCLFSIEGLEIGVTTVDTVRHLLDAECCSVDAGDKIKRAMGYLFHQASFYPLNPPPEEIPLDVDMLNEFGRLTRVPNIMVCPSSMNRFVREINGCVCINPGFLDCHETDGSGSYARLVIYPPEQPAVAPASAANDGDSNQQTTTATVVVQPPPASYIACQIVKS
ncbi:DNA polymerase alpha subunit B-like [Anopheles albimanus]|uniref:DNA polymerase alpha subunit B-like n=1 Tax=Anopheles albimanus TaxID=7167 RepID=UPI001641D1BF|nr:DNA polymerase alpha subunit B-like [Anopheles albimanus]